MRRLLFIFILLSGLPLYAMSPGINWDKAIDNAIKRYGLKTEAELTEYFSKAGIAYPPKETALLAFKSERYIELWAQDHNKKWTYIHRYPLTAYSGKLGPKLRENDRQIPEGIYQLVSFNPFSSMHLSMMVNYPNAFDIQQAKREKRKKPGNNIFLHGKASSVGCLAVGDYAIDQLFLLARRVGLKHIKLIIAPNDLRKSSPLTSGNQPAWLPRLYKKIKRELKVFGNYPAQTSRG